MPADIAKIVTLNVALLKDLSLAEVLEYHPLLDAQGFAYRKARKVKPIKARPINTILDKGEQSQSIWEKLLLATLEGSQALKRDSFICWGVNDDVWQQAADKLHAKYTPTEMDVDGWVTFVPKETDDAVMNAFQIPLDLDEAGPAGGFSITNPWWGDERVMDDAKVYLHYGVVGDCVMQNQTDAQDTYRIAQSFFAATYEWE